MAMANAAEVSCLDEEHKSVKVIHKRRSSIFHTRIIACNEYEDDNERSNKNKDNSYIKVFNLKEYIEKLRQERKDWQQEYKKRKIERKNLTKQKAKIETQGQILDINILTESERAFLIARPNYEYICQSSKKLLDVALKISTLNQLIYKLNQQLVEKMENNISKATRNVIQISKQ